MILFKPHDLTTKRMCAYLLSDMTGQVQFAGVCKVQMLWHTPDARKNANFERIFGPDKEAMITILKVCERGHEARNAVHDWIAANYTPFMNRYGNMAKAWRTPIICLETSEIFDGVKEAALGANAPASTMTFHVNGDLRYPTVNGKTYRWFNL